MNKEISKKTQFMLSGCKQNLFLMSRKAIIEEIEGVEEVKLWYGSCCYIKNNYKEALNELKSKFNTVSIIAEITTSTIIHVDAIVC